MTTHRAGISGMSGAGLIVTSTVCLALLMALGTICYLSARDMPIPVDLERIATGLILAATGLLAKTWADASDGQPQPVEVRNPPNDPVVTADVAEVPFVASKRTARKRINIVPKGQASQDEPDPAA